MDKKRKYVKPMKEREKYKKRNDEEVNGHRGKRGVPAPHGAWKAGQRKSQKQTDNDSSRPGRAVELNLMSTV